MNKKAKLLYALLLFLCFLSVEVFGDLKITGLMQNENGKFNITFNNAFTAKNIALKNKNGIKTAEFPAYISKNGIRKQFSVLERNYGKYITEVLSSQKVDIYEESVSFAINKFSLNKTAGNIKVFASVIFEDKIEVECRLMSGKKGIWIAWPSNKTDSGWEKEFIFNDKDLKKAVESALLEKYKYGENEEK